MDKIVGQDRAIDLLQRALRSGRLHHAYIFHGPAGVGKFTTALALARNLLCHQPQTNAAQRRVSCGKCPSCTLLTPRSAGPVGDEEARPPAHPDLHVISKELARFSADPAIRRRKQTTIAYEVLREFLLEPVYRTAQLRHGKVFIIDEAELIDPRGQNILLKTLEEPPPETYLILITAGEDRLLPTIRSRCQRIAFAPLPMETIARWIDAQDAKLAPAQRDWLVGFAAGSLGRADLALRHNLAAWAGAILPALDEMEKRSCPVELGKTLATFVGEFAEARVAQSPKVEGEHVASKEAANKLGMSLLCLMVTQIARQRLRSLAERLASADVAQREAALGPWLGVIDAVQRTEAEIAANLNLGLACDHLVTALTACLANPVTPGIIPAGALR